MLYNSTRGNDGGYSSAYVIKTGLAADGGLFVPEAVPTLTLDEIKTMAGMDYAALAARILGMFLTDYTKEELEAAANEAYSFERFGDCAAPVAMLDGRYVMELWHGPTCAFKDMALQIMPRLLSVALDKCGEKRTAHILVATSGDTGKAALEGYADVPKVKIQVFYPSDGVSKMQKLQMATQKGANVDVCGIKGNFDDAQSAVKRIFASAEMASELEKNGSFFSSANSINWGRLAPQIAYYFHAYCTLLDNGVIQTGDLINVTVPTGNFGNILAGFIAKKMGLPIDKLVCASNKNNILTDFFASGKYDRNRPFYTTMSPSMDILISSNLERLLYFAFGAERCAEWMKQLKDNGVFDIGENINELTKDFVGLSCDEEGTAKAIKKYFNSYGYLADPHTAVALSCADEHIKTDAKPMVVVSTASAYKFPRSVLCSLGADAPYEDLDCVSALKLISGAEVPAGLAKLNTADVRFTKVIEKEEIDAQVLSF